MKIAMDEDVRCVGCLGTIDDEVAVTIGGRGDWGEETEVCVLGAIVACHF